MEHYYSSLSHSAVRILITHCFIVIRDFVRDELHLNPLAVFNPVIWKTFTGVAEVYQKEKNECTAHINAIDWKYPVLAAALSECTCPKCGSGLLDTAPDCKDRDRAEFTCISCRNTFDFETVACRAISDFLVQPNYRSMKESGQPGIIACPNCGKETYFMEDDVCVLCEESAPRTCVMCRGKIPPEEIGGSSLCGYCSHMMSKNN